MVKWWFCRLHSHETALVLKGGRGEMIGDKATNPT